MRHDYKILLGGHRSLISDFRSLSGCTKKLEWCMEKGEEDETTSTDWNEQEFTRLYEDGVPETRPTKQKDLPRRDLWTCRRRDRSSETSLL